MYTNFLPGYLENIFVNAPIGIFTTNLERIITSANQIAAKLHGCDHGYQLNGKIFPDFICNHRFLLEKLQLVINSTLNKADVDYEINTANEVKTIRLVCTLLRDEKYAPIGLLNMCEDITKEKFLVEQVRNYTHNLEHMVQEKTEELKNANLQLMHSEKLRMLGNLVVSVAHEMGNPLCSLEYLLADVKESLQDNKLKQSIDLCRSEIERMGRLLYRLRELYRPSETRKSLININQLLEDILQINRLYLANNYVLVEKYFFPDMPAVFVFPDQIKQVFMNLIINAVDSMANGGCLKIYTRLNGKSIIVEVADSGIGIPKENIDNIFKSFFTTKNNSNGLGLGLSVSSQIINAHGGKIWVESEVNRGTTFFISLPI
ncbi:MAG: hypothetical protein HZA78_04830 [Candidatus Schekmanbacteria bacterium]|nr:hypothetical protein [Candidatus Schekmanbacteria bacterium]